MSLINKDTPMKEILVLFTITVLIFAYAIFSLFTKYPFWYAVSTLLLFSGIIISQAFVILGINPFARKNGEIKN